MQAELRSQNNMLVIILSMAVSLCFGMGSKEIEDRLHKEHLRIDAIDSIKDESNIDSISDYSEIFEKEFANLLSNNPTTLDYNFEHLSKDRITIINSEDKKIRVYSWDNWTGGSMRSFSSIFQYRTNNGIQTKLKSSIPSNENNVGMPFYSRLFTFNLNGNIYYLAICNGIYSTKDASESVEIYSIEGDSLNSSVKLIKTKRGLTNVIRVDYDFFSIVDRQDRTLIKVDKSDNSFTIPVVYKNGKVTNKVIKYKFTGQYFEVEK